MCLGGEIARGVNKIVEVFCDTSLISLWNRWHVVCIIYKCEAIKPGKNKGEDNDMRVFIQYEKRAILRKKQALKADIQFIKAIGLLFLTLLITTILTK